MTEEQRAQFLEDLTAANRTLIELAGIDGKDRTPLRSETVRECMSVYLRLLRFQAAVPLLEPEAMRLQMTLDRLQSNLRFFGEDVRF
jgi:hypothetical protein